MSRMQVADCTGKNRVVGWGAKGKPPRKSVMFDITVIFDVWSVFDALLPVFCGGGGSSCGDEGAINVDRPGSFSVIQVWCRFIDGQYRISACGREECWR